MDDDTLGLIISSARNRRELAWLRSHVSDDVIRDAVVQLAGARKPFVLNVVRVLGLELPNLAETPPDVARELIAELKASIKISGPVVR